MNRARASPDGVFALVDIKGREKWLVFNLYDAEGRPVHDAAKEVLPRVFRARRAEKEPHGDV